MKYIKYLFLVIMLLAIAAIVFAGDLPDQNVTPGVVNSNITQANIQQTICVHNWTSTIRPKASYTNKLKLQQLLGSGFYESYKSDLPPSAFEEDHLISLELGGHPTDPRNLWPQHWSHPWGAHEKDQLENRLHALVCSGLLPLADAQKAISTNWIKAYKQYVTRK